MEDYRLTQTGQEVQDILNNAAMQSELTAETERATEAEETLQSNIESEASDRQDADQALSDAIDLESNRASEAEGALGERISDIEGVIPSAASEENKLVDESKMNSSISTATATYRGSFNIVSDLHLAVDATHEQIATLLATVIATADNNDYCYVQIPTSAETPSLIAKVERYKFNGTAWAFEYAINNSGFTAEQWAALNSGITSGLVAKLGALPTASELSALLVGKQDVLTFDNTPTEGSINPVKSGGVYDAIGDESSRAQEAEGEIAGRVSDIEDMIPVAASDQNKLVDESKMNSSISTATATYRGSFNIVSDLHLAVDATHEQIGTMLATVIATADNNDYCYVQIPTSGETPSLIAKVERYKFNGTAWSFEYALNNSGFTAEQWAALNSGISSGLVAKLNALPTASELTALLAAKQDVLTFDDVPTEGSSHPVKSGGVYTANKNLSDAIEAILLLIPSAASALNKLVDESLMNSSISTATATYRGSFNLVTDLHLAVDATRTEIAAALASAIATADNNDYAFVQIPTSSETASEIASTDRYKFNGTAWSFEYTLNNSGFSASQWEAINSAITSALVAKLRALPTASELTETLGILNTGISSINQKIPANASMANKLVSESTLYEVIAQVIGAIDATFNVQSVDGHVTLHITQLDGEITSVQVQTSDIASAADLTLLASRVTTAEGNINTLSGRISTNESDISDLQDAYEALTQSALVIVQPTDTWPVASPATKTIYRVVDRVNTPPQYYSDYMWNGTSMVLMATYNNVIDDVPTAGSPNLVKSSGVYNFAHDLAFITNGIPTLDIINNTFTLPSGSYITAKGITILSLEQDIIWRRTDAISLNAGGYLVLNLSTLEKRTVPATLDPECNANECVVALVDWWNDVIKGNFSRYYINQNYVDFKLLSKKSLPRPVFWRQGHIEIIKNRTNNGSISVRVLEDCMFFLTDRFVTITASETYIDLSTATVALLCIEYTTDGNYILSLQNYDNYYKENLYVITTIFYNYLGDAADDGYEGLISDIDSSALAKITYLRSTKVAKDWAYKTKLPEYNKNVFGKDFVYNKEKILDIKFLITDLNTLIRARSEFLYLTPGEKYVVIQKHGYTQYQYIILDSNSGNLTPDGYQTKTREIIIPSDGIIQIMLKKSDNTEFLASDLELLNSNNVFELYNNNKVENVNSILNQNVITNLWGSVEFLDGYFYGINPNTNPITYNGLTENVSMTCCEVEIKPGSKLYTFAPYMMIAYLDENKNFIDGYYYNYESTQPTLIPRVTDVPWNAVYAQISTRLSHKYETVVSESPFPSVGLDSYRNVSKELVPESQIVHQELNCIYDRKDFVSTAEHNNLAFTGTVTVNSENHLVMSSNSGAKITGLFTTVDKSMIGANLKITTVPSGTRIVRFGYFGSAVVGTGITDSDTWIDVYSDKVNLYNGNLSGGQSTIKATANLSEIISADDVIELMIIKDSIYHHKVKVMKRYVEIGEIELTATVDPNDPDHELDQMRSWGAPAIWSEPGADIIVERMFFYSTCPQYAKLAIVGDSYVENMSRSKASGWVRLLEEKIGSENLFISGQGGGSASALITKLPVELNLCRPKYVVLHTGTNDGFSGTESQINTYKERLLLLIDMVKAVNAIPILMTTPRVFSGSNDDLNFITVINPWIKSLGYMYVDVAYCLSTGDGVTMDTNRMRPDLVHPNHVGAEAILNWVENNLPEIF